jgi:hypothetical protein
VIEADRRLWLERLIAACDRVAADVPDPRDPYLRTLLADAAELRARLVAELERTEGPDDPAS